MHVYTEMHGTMEYVNKRAFLPDSTSLPPISGKFQRSNKPKCFRVNNLTVLFS